MVETASPTLSQLSLRIRSPALSSAPFAASVAMAAIGVIPEKSTRLSSVRGFGRFTSPALRSDSKREIFATPDSPFSSASMFFSVPIPSGVIAEQPVITARTSDSGFSRRTKESFATTTAALLPANA